MKGKKKFCSVGPVLAHCTQQQQIICYDLFQYVILKITKDVIPILHSERCFSFPSILQYISQLESEK
jgi:hypothetical protein